MIYYPCHHNSIFFIILSSMIQRGVVIQQSVSIGQVVQQPQPQPPIQIVEQKLPPPPLQQADLKYEIPDEALFSSKLLKKGQINWISNEQAILTTKHFEQYPIASITKLKIKKESEVQGSYIIKITLNEKNDVFFALPKEVTYQWFYKAFWAVLTSRQLHCDPNQQFINSCDGQILKKGEFLGGWDPRYVLITAKDGLMSFRSKEEPPTLRITETHEVWSRFETINSNKWVVIKLWHGFIKEEFAVPVYRAMKWVKAFYSLLRI